MKSLVKGSAGQGKMVRVSANSTAEYLISFNGLR